MSYQVFVDAQLLWDPYDDNDVVSSASISQAVNAAAYLDMEITSSNVPINEGSSSVEVRWESKTLFYGRVTDVSQGIDGSWQVSAVSNIDRLNDVLVRPHSTSGDVGEQVPSTLSGYFNWLVEQYNERAVGGYRINVRTNQGDELHEGALSVSEDGWPTVAAAVQDGVLSYGGYLDFIPYSGGADIDFYADIHDANLQIVDLGENITDITVKRSSEGQRTALVPYGSDDDGNNYDLTSATSTDLQLVRNAGYSVLGDAIYDPEYVAEYGYREERHEFPGVTSVAELLREAVPYLRTMVAPRLTVECRAVDMALYREGYEHLRVGQAVRVRSEPHGVDEYLAVQDMDLDLMDPSQTTYTLGVSYDTLTGQQSAYLAQLNGSINHALDRVTEAEDTISHVVNDVDVEYYVSDSPDEPIGGEWGVGTITAVDNKYVFSHVRKEQADGTVAISDPTLLTTQVRHSLQLHRDLGDDVVWVSYVAANYDVTDEAAGIVRIYGQMGGWEAEEQGAVTVAFGFQDSAYQTGESLAGVGVVTEKSSDIDFGRTDIVSYVDNGRVGVYIRLTGKVLVNLYADGDGFSTPFIELKSEPSGTKVFDLAETQTTYESAILQADNALRLYVQATYTTQAATEEIQSAFDLRANQIEASVSEKMDTEVANQTFVNQSTFNQFSDSITTSVEQTQTIANGASSAASAAQSTADSALEAAQGAASDLTEFAQSVTGDLSDLQSQIDGSIQTWFYEGVPTLENAPASGWTTDAIRNNHLGDLYYDTDTDYAYRFMQVDGAYSWDRIQDTDAIKALADAAAAQDTADGKRRVFVAQPMPPYDVGDLWAQGSTGDLMRCQVAKTANQSYSSSDWVLATKYTDDTTADAAAEAAQTAITKATEVEQTVDGITTTVSETVQTANEAYTKASTLEQTVDGFEARLDGIVGVNLIPNSTNPQSSDDWSAWFTPAANATNSCGLAGTFNFPEGTKVGDTFTLSLELDWTSFTAGTGGALVLPHIQFYWNNSRSSGIPRVFDDNFAHASAAAGTRAFSYTGKITTTAQATGTVCYNFRTDYSNGSGKIRIRRLKLEKGSVATEWTSAPRDPEDAAKTATNYLKFDSSGLCVGNMTAGTLGYNALITGSEYQIRNGSTVLSSFGSSVARLGQNSTSAQVQMCGGRGVISARGSGIQVRGSSSTTWMALNTSVDIYSNSAGNGLASEITLGGGSIDVLGDYGVKIGQSRSTRLWGIWAGSKVISCSGSSAYQTVFTSSQITSMIGRAHGGYDVCLVMNGDSVAWNHSFGGSPYWNGSSIRVNVGATPANGQQIRMNYIYIAV